MFFFFNCLSGYLIADIFGVMHDMVAKMKYWTWSASAEKKKYEVDDMTEA